jgi:hypothetical protein
MIRAGPCQEMSHHSSPLDEPKKMMRRRLRLLVRLTTLAYVALPGADPVAVDS